MKSSKDAIAAKEGSVGALIDGWPIKIDYSTKTQFPYRSDLESPQPNSSIDTQNTTSVSVNYLFIILYNN